MKIMKNLVEEVVPRKKLNNINSSQCNRVLHCAVSTAAPIIQNKEVASHV